MISIRDRGMLTGWRSRCALMTFITGTDANTGRPLDTDIMDILQLMTS